MNERPPAFRGIRHIAFRVTNLEECERFYTDVMGMKLLNRANDNLVYLTCGNDNLSLARANSEPKDGGVFDHYGFIVESREPYGMQLLAALAEVRSISSACLRVPAVLRPSNAGRALQALGALRPG